MMYVLVKPLSEVRVAERDTHDTPLNVRDATPFILETQLHKRIEKHID